MSVSNRVFHAPRSDTDDRGIYLRGEGWFLYLWGRGGVGSAEEGGVNARPFFTLITIRDRDGERGEKRTSGGREGWTTVSRGAKAACYSARRYYVKISGWIFFAISRSFENCYVATGLEIIFLSQRKNKLVTLLDVMTRG